MKIITEKKKEIFDVDKAKRQIESFLDSTIEARAESEKCRDYYDGKQWTAEQARKLKARNQATVVINRVKPKVEGLKGLLENRKADIKAFPRNSGRDEQSAHAVTDSLRYVADNNDFDSIKSQCFEDKIIEGYCAAIVEIIPTNDDPANIQIKRIPYNRFYFDPCSRNKDFSDARFMGQIDWYDREVVEEMFPNANIDNLTKNPTTQNSSDTFEDSKKWFDGDSQRERIRIAQHWCIHDGVWYVSIISGDEFLEKPTISEYLDDEGKPCCPIVADTAYIDRDNNRHGEVSFFLSAQDEINHRRSKALHLLNSKQTFSKKGAIDDVPALKKELKKPDGHVVVQGDMTDFQILDTSKMTQGQFSMYQDSKAELDAVSFNAQLSGERQGGNLSGVAINKLQSAGTLETNSLFTGLSVWEKKIFRQVWARIKQFWNEQKWVRITDDQDSLRWVGLNARISFQELLEETISDESKPKNMRVGATAVLQQMMNNQDPRLQEIVDIRNSTPNLDVDIKLEQSFDYVNSRAEQFALITQFAQSSKDIDILDLLALSDLKDKDKFIEKIESRRNAQSQAANSQAQLTQQEMISKNAKIGADAQLAQQKATQTAIENQLLLNNPPAEVSSVSV